MEAGGDGRESGDVLSRFRADVPLESGEEEKSDTRASRARKAEAIRDAIQRNRERRKDYRLVTIQLKFQNLSKRAEDQLNRAFLEAKWLYNWLLADLKRLQQPLCKVSVVEVKVGEVFEQRHLTVLGSQLKVEIGRRMWWNLRSLAAKKARGRRIGYLRYKANIASIPLPQYGITYRFDFRRNRVRIQRLGEFRVLGLRQIPAGAEIASAVLLRKPRGYYLHVTCYIPPAIAAARQGVLDAAIGIDFGIATKVTLSNGMKINYEIPETRRITRLRRQIRRSDTDSQNQKWRRVLLQRECERLANRRRDAQNKILAFLRLYRTVVFQDDCVQGWARLLGRDVVYSAGIGRIREKLRASRGTISVGRFEPTSQECFACGSRRAMPLNQRTYSCPCGYTNDRDVNSALVILRKGLGLKPSRAAQPDDGALQTVGLDRPELTPLEKQASALILGSNPSISVSFFVEGGSPR